MGLSLNTGWLGGCVAEVWLAGRPWIPVLGGTAAALFMIGMALRYWTIRTLGGRWSTRVLALPCEPLVSAGPFRWLRHPNYLGEIMIYGSFALMVWHWLPVVVLAWVWLGLFAVNMAMKEASMSRYPEWADYRKRTWWLVPFVV